MFSKKYLVLIFASLLVGGVIAILTPVDANAGATGLGCCINNSLSGNCVGCGTEDDSCQSEQKGSCPDVVTDPGDCGGEENGRGCFVPGAVCFQIDVNTGICGEAPEAPECTMDSECDDGDDCTDDVCTASGVCAHMFNEEIEGCVEVIEPPTPSAPIPTLGQWGMIVATIILGFFAVVMLWRSKDSEI